MAGLRVGVDDLDAGLLVVVDREGLLVGVEDLAVDLVGVEDLAGTVGLDEDEIGREVGVEDLEGLEVVVEVGFDIVVLLETGFDIGLDDVPDAGLPVGVEGLELGPPEEDGLRSPTLGPGDDARCLDTMFLPVASDWLFDSYTISNQVNNIISSQVF